MTGAPPLAGIILAGGDSQRYSGGAEPKALAPIAGAPLLLHVAAGLARAGARRVIVLTGRNHGALCAGLGLTPASQPTGSAFGLLTIGQPGGGRDSVAIELRHSGDSAGTGGRLGALNRAEIGAAALLSYTDILTDAPLAGLLDLIAGGAELALLAVQPRLPWGVLELDDGHRLIGFAEKPLDSTRWINAGVMAITPAVLDRIAGPADMLEDQVMARILAAPQSRVQVLRHRGQWDALDTRKEINAVDAAARAGTAPWRRWGSLCLTAGGAGL